MNILIPMAGAGKRFAEAGYEKPKPLIDVCGKPMIQRVIENLGLENDFIFIIQEQHWHKYNKEFTDIFLKTNSYRVLLTDGLTEGALCTAMIAKHEIDLNSPLMIANSDQIMEWDRTDFYDKFYANDVFDGCIFTFKSTEDKHSYVKVEYNIVTEVAEKKVISDIATVGVYVWRYGADFIAAAEQMFKKNIRTNNEFYLAPTYNENIAMDATIGTYKITNHHPIGTPEDLKKYEELLNGKSE